MTLDELHAQLEQAFRELDQLAERWLDLAAGGRIHERIALDKHVDEQIRVTRRLERRIHRRTSKHASRDPRDPHPPNPARGSLSPTVPGA